MLVRFKTAHELDIFIKINYCILSMITAMSSKFYENTFFTLATYTLLLNMSFCIKKKMAAVPQL